MELLVNILQMKEKGCNYKQQQVVQNVLFQLILTLGASLLNRLIFKSDGLIVSYLINTKLTLPQKWTTSEYRFYHMFKDTLILHRLWISIVFIITYYKLLYKNSNINTHFILSLMAIGNGVQVLAGVMMLFKCR